MTDLQTAIEAIKANLPMCQRFMDYYGGAHPLAFSTEKFKSSFGTTLKNMRDNLCPIVVDAAADRMEIINFAGDEAGKEVADSIWKLWQRERMELVSNETHKDALKCGMAYLIVWNDKENNARFYLQDPRNCVVIEDEETGDPLFAAKQWRDAEDYVHLNLYYPDRIERRISIKKYDQNIGIKDTNFRQDGENVPNPYGIIPMFKFATHPVLSDAIPIQDALNKTVADSLVAGEFMAYPQRWATGLEPPTDELTGAQKELFKAGLDRLWFTNSETVKFGQFDPANLESYLKVSDSWRLEMARVSGTPLHFFSINTSDAISGEALKTLESRFTKKVTRLTINFGAVWCKAMSLALKIENTSAPENLTAQWAPVEQRSEKEFIETQILKQDLGVPNEVLLEEIGYTKEDIAKFDIEDEPPTIIDPAVAMAQAQMNGK